MIKEEKDLELLIGFGTDDGENLARGHAGDAKYIYLYRFSDIKEEEFIEKRSNIELGAGQSLKPGSPEMAKARSAVFKNLDVLVGKGFGPGLPNLLKQFVCITIKVDSVKQAIEIIRDNLDRIKEEKDRGGARDHIILEA